MRNTPELEPNQGIKTRQAERNVSNEVRKGGTREGSMQRDLDLFSHESENGGSGLSFQSGVFPGQVCRGGPCLAPA